MIVLETRKDTPKPVMSQTLTGHCAIVVGSELANGAQRFPVLRLIIVFQSVSKCVIDRLLHAKRTIHLECHT